MSDKITFSYKNALPFISDNEILMQKEMIGAAHDMIHKKCGAGSDFLGWLHLPQQYDKEEFSRIKRCAEKIRSDSDVL